MKNTLLVVQLFILVLISACAGISSEVSSIDAFKETTYSQYAWATKAMSPQEGRAKRLTTFDAHLRRLVDQELQAKGYQLVAAEQAEFKVGYRLNRSVTVGQGGGGSAMDTAWDVNGNANTAMMSTEPSTIKETHFRINFIDTKTKKELWFAHLKKIFSEPLYDENKAAKGLHRLIQKIFTNLPRY